MNKTYRRGDMYYADLGRGIGSEQEGYRPVLIIQNDTGNLAPHVCAFSDDGRGVQSDEMMRQAMKKIKQLDKMVAAHLSLIHIFSMTRRLTTLS